MAVGRYLLAWFPMVLIAVGNGAFRESILRPQFGKLHARQLSTLLLIALFAAYVWIVVRVSPIDPAARRRLSASHARAHAHLRMRSTASYPASRGGRSPPTITSPRGASGCSYRSGLRWRLTSFIACRCKHERRRDAAAQSVVCIGCGRIKGAQPCVLALQPRPNL
jgi:hypothetical protein